MAGFYFKNGYIHKTTAVLVMDKNPGEKKKEVRAEICSGKGTFE